MEILSEQDMPVRLQDLTTIAGMNASTILRFLKALLDNEYVAQEADTGRYFMTYKLCTLSNNITSRMNISRICNESLHEIALQYGESVNLAVEQEMRVVYILVLNGRNQILTTRQRIGNIAPMHCTGVGKLMLLNYNESKIDQLIQIRGLQKFTENTLVTKEALMNELKIVSEAGYAYDNEECEVGMRCVATPVYDYTGKIIAGLSVSGPSIRMTGDHLKNILDSLISAASDASRKLGYR